MKIEFPIPEGFTPPEGVKEGEDFEFMVTGRLSGNNLVITSVEGQPVGDNKEAQPAEAETMAPDDRSFVDSVETGLS